MTGIHKKERPTSIEALCIFNFLGAAITPVIIMGHIMNPTTPKWYPPYLTVYVLVSLASLVGIWMMKRKALIVYASVILVNQSIHIGIHQWNPLSLLLPAFLLFFGIKNIKKMEM